MRKNKGLILILVIIAISLYSCQDTKINKPTTTEEQTIQQDSLEATDTESTIETQVEIDTKNENINILQDVTDKIKELDTEENREKAKTVISKGKNLIKEGFNETKEAVDKLISKESAIETSEKISELPENHNYYAVTGDADFTQEFPQSGKITYGPLDNYGRPSKAIATIEASTVFAKAERGKLENPAGWSGKNPRVTINHPDGTTYNGYFWNRSHMIAADFGGNGSYNNLVTGTRSQNVGGRKNDGGMAYAENLVREYFNNGYDGPVYYEVINNYNNDEILPRTTTVNILSKDRILNTQVEVYNTANGYTINYYNGTFEKN